jgi:hypothetical protein
MPCVVGPYISVNCTQTLIQHHCHFDPTPGNPKGYLERFDGADNPRLGPVRVLISPLLYPMDKTTLASLIYSYMTRSTFYLKEPAP